MLDLDPGVIVIQALLWSWLISRYLPLAWSTPFANSASSASSCVHLYYYIIKPIKYNLIIITWVDSANLIRSWADSATCTRF
jgi:hypothetical protein